MAKDKIEYAKPRKDGNLYGLAREPKGRKEKAAELKWQEEYIKKHPVQEHEHPYWDKK